MSDMQGVYKYKPEALSFRSWVENGVKPTDSAKSGTYMTSTMEYKEQLSADSQVATFYPSL